ncbi:hypothetical protein GOTRE_009_00210 [Gordonia terrae NBRC 100016]|uniref:Uncharacterized protein n=1 Tax=Gordonia terrae NBRC 100016 TaxID=1089454 RepID=A0ABQ0H8B9_9ACTN|nr:hypothetical protein GOTRE_009_00210 [Gordonia terrae NBRC 100016]
MAILLSVASQCLSGVAIRMATPLAGGPAGGVRRGVAHDPDDDRRTDRARAPGSGAVSGLEPAREVSLAI